MCFSIPIRVLKIEDNTACLENGQKVAIGKDLKVHNGNYLQVTGDIAVGVLSEKEAITIRRLIKRLNS